MVDLVWGLLSLAVELPGIVASSLTSPPPNLPRSAPPSVQATAQPQKNLPMPSASDRATAEAYFQRGNIYFKAGEYERAIQDFDFATGLYPGFAAAYMARGLAYRARGDQNRAKADLDYAKYLDPTQSPAN